MRLADRAKTIFRGALATLDPARLSAEAVEALAIDGPVELWAVGKAAETMARGVRAAVPVPRELVVTRDDAGHPVPDARSLGVGTTLLERAALLGPDERVVLALSGGASALAVAPAWGLTLDEKIAATRAVAQSGADIAALNCVRKHLSLLKGGRLGAAMRARLSAVILSDVVGDDPSIIGSGPVTADPTTFADALEICRRAPGVPKRVLGVLEDGVRGTLPETPKELAIETRVIAGPGDLALAAGRIARVTPEPLYTGTVEDLAARLAAATSTTVFVGEPTIALPPDPGRGGRAQHTALLAAQALARQADTERVILCAATDGSDGPTADAGGLITPAVVEWVRAHPTQVAMALASHDSGRLLAAAGALFTTGPTGTNLCDLYVVVA